MSPSLIRDHSFRELEAGHKFQLRSMFGISRNANQLTGLLRPFAAKNCDRHPAHPLVIDEKILYFLKHNRIQVLEAVHFRIEQGRTCCSNESIVARFLAALLLLGFDDSEEPAIYQSAGE